MEIAKALGIVQSWVSKYDLELVQPHNLSRRDNFTFYGYNVWGFKDES